MPRYNVPDIRATEFETAKVVFERRPFIPLPKPLKAY
jgi:hypothetical protein